MKDEKNLKGYKMKTQDGGGEIHSEEDEDMSDTLKLDKGTDSIRKHVVQLNLAFQAEITKILQVHSDVNFQNALTLNKEMQNQLLVMRERLQQLLKSVYKRYELNKQRLERGIKRSKQGFGMRGAYLKGGTFYFKGNMFFKDHNCRNAPNNTDYEERCMQGEMFPMDFELRGRHVWSLVDKAGIVEAIKEQIVDYLHDRKLKPKSKRRNGPNGAQIAVHTQKLVHLLTKVGGDFKVDWAQVSAHNVNYRHSAISCAAMWNLYLHPSLKRSDWTAEENQSLLDAVKQYNLQNWSAIAATVGKRSDYQCFIQYQTTVCYMHTERWSKWNKKDDQRLLDVIGKSTANGVINWGIVASHFPQKKKTSLQMRYVDRLNPQISHAPFTPEEDLILLAAVEQYGEQFSRFPRTLLPNRSLTQLRSRYRNTLQQRIYQDPWTVQDDEKLMEFIATHGTSAWLHCSQTLGNHSRTSCRTRFLTIKKFFEKKPDATLVDLPRKKVRLMTNTINTENWLEKLSELRENPNAEFRQTKEEKKKMRAKAKPHKKKRIPNKKPAKMKKTKKAESGGKLLLKRRSYSSRKNPIYTQRLRANELNLYHFFKYAYNFEFGVDPCTRPAEAYSLTFAANVLQYKTVAGTEFIGDEYFIPKVRRKCRQVLQQPKELQDGSQQEDFPPSWCTVMAFRALCVQSAQVNNAVEYELPAVIANESHVQLFRGRLRNLLYQTALLSRLNPDMVDNAQFFEEPKVENIPENTTNKLMLKTESEIIMAEAKAAVDMTEEQRLSLEQLGAIRAAAKRRKRKVPTNSDAESVASAPNKQPKLEPSSGGCTQQKQPLEEIKTEIET